MSSTNEKQQQQQQQRLKRPDVGARDRKLDTLNVQLKKIDQEIALLRKQIDQFQASDTSSAERKKLQDQNKEIIKTQADLKQRRNTIHESIKQLDAQIKRKTSEINDKVGGSSRRGKYQSVADAKQRIAEIDDMIGSGELSLVQEKMFVKEMQALNKLIKDLQLVEPIRKSVEDDKAKIVKLKEKLSTLNNRELSKQFEDNQKKLDSLSASSKTMYDKRQTLFNKRSALYKKRDELYSQIRQIRNDFDNEFKAYRAKLEKERLRREEEQVLSKLYEERDAKIGKLEEKLLHARTPAYTYEIEAIENVLVHLDPTYEKPKRSVFDELTASSTAPVSRATPAKVVENTDLVRVEKVENDMFANTAPSKSKKYKKKQQQKSQAKKAAAAAAASADNGSSTTAADGKFSLEPTLIATLAELDVIVPISKADVPKAIEQLKAKHEKYLSTQEEQTKANIKKAEDDLEKVKADYAAKEAKVKQDLETKRQKEQAEAEAEAAESETKSD